MGRPLKTFSGTALASPTIARAVGQTHHVGQVTVYVTATSKTAAAGTLTALGFYAPAGRLSQSSSTTAAALTQAGLLDAPTVLVTHNNRFGPVARINDDRSPTVIGELVSRRPQIVMVGKTTIREFATVFVPTADSETREG